MRTPGKRLLHYASSKASFSKGESQSKLHFPIHKYSHKISSKKCKLKPKHHTKTTGSKRNLQSGKPRKTLQNKSAKGRSSLKLICEKHSHLGDGEDMINAGGDGGLERRNKRRRRKRKKGNIVQDEASRLQRRTRYLLIRMKLEQNLIDAYSGEGWKGQSREKIKPEKELQRAKKQILNCKLGIRDAIHQLELLSSEGCIENSMIYPDGSVFHEHIFCAKCKSSEAFPDNDIILCDGTCNCGFHQKCLEPPLAKIPPGDQGWLCKFCECKMEILEAINAHIGTSFSMNSSWEDIFMEAASGPNCESSYLDPAQELLSEDSEDDDYDPEMNRKSESRTSIEEDMSDDASSSCSLLCSSDEASSRSRRLLDGDMYGECSQGKSTSRKKSHCNSINSIDSDDSGDHELKNYRRQRRDVDYKKLYDEMFGKDLHENEQQSEDEDWGPHRKKQRKIEADSGSTINTCVDEDGCPKVQFTKEVEKKLPSIPRDRKPLFRIPRDAVEKLRQIFVENELPSRAVKEDLSKQLGLASEKVSKWFKNARYAALKIRKEESTKVLNDYINKKSSINIGKNRGSGGATLKEKYYSLTPLCGMHVPKNLKILRRKNPKSITTPLRKQHKRTSALPTNTIEVAFSSEQVRAFRRRNPFESKIVNLKVGANLEMKDSEQLYLKEMERLCNLEERLQKMKAAVKACGDRHVSREACSMEQIVIFVPVAEVKEKVECQTNDLIHQRPREQEH